MRTNAFYSYYCSLFFCLLMVSVRGQISGTVTLNSASATAGTNYQSFTALAQALNTSGINGPLTVNVLSGSGPYIENPKFNQVNGASSINTITINGFGNILSFTSTNSSQAITLELNGSDYLNINNLNIVAGGTVFGTACLLYNNADNNMFNACTFSCIVNGTSSNLIPLAISGSSANALTLGPSGSNNTFMNCQTYNGYYGMLVYTNTVSPYSSGNKFISCTMTDWYVYGLYSYYSRNLTLKHCNVSRPTRIQNTTVYGIYLFENSGVMCDANCIQNLYGAIPSSTNTAYAIYCSGNSLPANAGSNTFQNNSISNINSNAAIYGMYLFNFDGFVYHNTVVLNDQTATTSQSTYGIYIYMMSGNDSMRVKNNLSYVTRSGNGNKYCVYYGATQNFRSDYNLLYMGSTAGLNYTGYYLGAWSTLSVMQTQNTDAHSANANPNFTFTSACSAIPTNTVIDNGGADMNVTLDYGDFIRHANTPDFGAFEFNTPACSGSPTANSITVSNATVCPGGVANLSLSFLNPQLGFTYQWQNSSTSAGGPFSNISGANSFSYSTDGLQKTNWYKVIMTCTNPGGTNIAPIEVVNVAAITISCSVGMPVCKGQSLTLTASGASTYTWANGSSVSSYTLMPLLTTTVLVIGSHASLGCNALNAALTVSVENCSSISSNEFESSLKLVPNPGSGEFNLSLPTAKPYTINILDVSGRSIYTSNGSEKTFLIHLEELEPGIYYLNVLQEHTLKTIKLIRE